MDANEKVLDEFKKLIQQMGADMEESENRVLNQGANIVFRVARENTPVGKSRKGHIGGTMRKNWQRSHIQKTGGKKTVRIYNGIDYAFYVNNGHRVVRDKKTIGYAMGKFMLEKGIEAAENALPGLFEREMRRVAKKNGFQFK